MNDIFYVIIRRKSNFGEMQREKYLNKPVSCGRLAFLRCYEAYVYSCLPTFRGSLFVPTSRDKRSLTRQTGRPQASINNCQHKLRNISEEQRPRLVTVLIISLTARTQSLLYKLKVTNDIFVTPYRISHTVLVKFEEIHEGEYGIP
jgi:hypothetical protein